MPESQWQYLDQWQGKDACIFALSLSPAQEFIAEARKSRDLRAGSLLLSWLSFKLYEPILQAYQESAFIVPACKGNPFVEEWKKHGGLELEQLKHLALGGESITNRAVGLIERNKLHLLKEAEENCCTAWNKYAACCKKRLAETVREGKWQTVYDRQMQDFSAAFAVYAVAAEADVNDLPGSIQHIIAQMERRKDSRLFKQWPGSGMPKCTQCGHREIIADSDDSENSFWPQINRRYQNIIRIRRVEDKEGRVKYEQRELLCACCLAKRLFAFDGRFFPPSEAVDSTMDIAAAPFLDELCKLAQEKEHSENFQRIMNNWLAWVKEYIPSCPQNKPVIDKSWRKTIAEFVLPYEQDDAETRKDIELINKEYLYSSDAENSLCLSPPSPYLAVLMLDGDKMGEKLSQHPELSSSLTEFSQAVPEIIKQHQGTAIYSSGDELLALLPKKNALAAAQAVQAKFSSLISETSCSAAITWFHCKSPLLQAVRNCREGLHEAKETFGRNSLVCTALISSASHRFGIPWTEQSVDMAAAIENVVWMLGPEGGLSKNFLHDLLEEFPSFVDAPPSRLFNSSSEKTIKAASDLLLPRMRWLWKRHSDETTPTLCAGEDCCQFLAAMAASLPGVNNNKAENFAACLRVVNFLTRS